MPGRGTIVGADQMPGSPWDQALRHSNLHQHGPLRRLKAFRIGRGSPPVPSSSLR